MSALSLTVGLGPLPAAADPEALVPDVQIRLVTQMPQTPFAVRIAQDPLDGSLYVLRQEGTILRLDVGQAAGDGRVDTVYTAADHGVEGDVIGMDFGPQGHLYLVSNHDAGFHRTTRITRGEALEGERRRWVELARTEPYELCDCAFNHGANGIAVSPDGRWVLVNSGARTDHGEVRDNGGRFPGLRESCLTAIILRLPAAAAGLVLPNDREALRRDGYLYAEGVRNTFDLAFSPRGELFGTENGPDRDVPEELNWIRQGHHYGFPWRFGVEDNPQSRPGYDAAGDVLLRPGFAGVADGSYRDDPDFPPPPGPFTDPVISLGPDADRFRDPVDGRLRDASDEGGTLATFSAHRSPLGLVFDTAGVLAPEYAGDAFVFSWTPGFPQEIGPRGPFGDASEDLLHVDLRRRGDGYEAVVRRIVHRFAHPVDAVLVGRRIYVIETATQRNIWEVTLPGDEATAVIEEGPVPAPTMALAPNAPNPFNGHTAFRFELPAATSVGLYVYNLAGQRVATLDRGARSAGRHRVVWDGRGNDGRPLASGVYIYRLETAVAVWSRKLLLVR